MPADEQPTNELEGVVSLTELVDYQPGAVVSRTIVKKPTGTVTAFATAGHLVRLPADKPHALKAITPFKMILIMVREVR